jgi:hypothetical protein
MKHGFWKRVGLLMLTMAVFWGFSACLKEEGKSSILFNDPQDIPFITDYLPMDLLQLFGEENIHFGDRPFNLDMEFVSKHQYEAVLTSAESHPSVGTTSPIKHYHRISQKYLQIADYYSITQEETYCEIISPVYLMGSDTAFTAYYFEQPNTVGSPVHAVLFSGKKSDAGVRDFRYGYKIIRYNDPVVPSSVYPVNTIFIFKDVDGMAETELWFNDSLMPPQPTN